MRGMNVSANHTVRIDYEREHGGGFDQRLGWGGRGLWRQRDDQRRHWQFSAGRLGERCFGRKRRSRV